MPSYRYVAFDSSGKREVGQATFPSELAALDDLISKGLTVVEMSPIDQNKDSGGNRGNSRLSTNDEAALAEQLASLTSARITPPEIVALLAASTGNAKTARYFERVGDFMNEGMTFPEAMARMPGVLSNQFLALARLAHSSKDPGKVYSDLAKGLRRRARVVGELKTSAIYPVLLMIMSALILGLMAFVLAPELEPVFEGRSAPLPFALTALAMLRAMLSSPAFWVVFAAGLFGIWRISASTGGGTAMNMLRYLPQIGPVLRNLDAAEISRGTSLLLTAGQGLAEALTEVSETFPQNPFATLVAEAASSLRSGGTAAGIFDADPSLSPLFRQLFALAERTNRFDDILPTLTISLEESAEAKIKRLMQFVGPGLTMALGLIIGLLVFSIMSAILSVNDVALGS